MAVFPALVEAVSVLRCSNSLERVGFRKGSLAVA